jgi:hypothetical protein
MRKMDKSKISDLFSTALDDDIDLTIPTRRKPVKSSSKKTQSKETAMQNNKTRFLAKLEEEAFAEMDEKDWFQYFVHKANEKGVRYITRNYAKEYAIIKSILNELSWLDVKNMIDFVFESNQDIVDKRTVGLWVLSKGWINSIFQSTQLWIAGQYKPKSAPLHNREWVAEASSKSSGTGLTYGKPIKDEIEEKPKTQVVKKGRIRF